MLWLFLNLGNLNSQPSELQVLAVWVKTIQNLQQTSARLQGHCPASVAHGTPVGGCCERPLNLLQSLGSRAKGQGLPGVLSANMLIFSRCLTSVLSS